MNKTVLSAGEPAFAVPAWVKSTFAAPPQFFRLSGPGTLVRLVQFGKTTYEGLELEGNDPAGRFWFEEDLLLRLTQRARLDLARQRAAARRPFAAPLSALIGNYVRHCLRADLAICKDWTHDFDAFHQLRLTPQARLLALVGPVARQAAYSENHPQHAAVVANDIWLGGQAMQYVIDFTCLANRSYARQILGPFRF